ncbi:uncharacterized protein LOC143636085 [Bidens hawaiensis]|uniref:uncharacterized protein LOC143636085 n=1 Tax=Bidens hawaiensis TaxID=980011 RepID=UPI00404A95E1
MERSEPTFVPEWLKSTAPHHQFQSSSLHSDEQVVSKATRNKSHVNTTDNDIGWPSSSYFRRSSSSNGSSHLRSYSSFGNGRYSDKEKSESKHRDYSDPLSSILPSRFEKDGLRRSHSSLSAKRGESWSRKPVAASNGGGSRSAGGVKIVFERDFPSLGAEDKQTDSGLSSVIQSLPIGNAAVIGGDGWTSALAEVPVIVGGNGSNSLVVQSSTSMGMGRNMAETLVQGPPRAQTVPQLSTGTQRLEELAVKQSRQLIPMTPSVPKVLALNTSDKPKPKVAQSQLQSSHVINHTHSPRAVSTKFDSLKTSSPVGKLHVLKPSRERNGATPTAKDNISPTGGNLPTSPLSVPSAVAVAERKPSVATLEKRPSPHAQSRNDFFNLMRKKSLTFVTPDNNGSPVSPIDDKPDETDTGSAVTVTEGGPQQSSEITACNGDADVATERSTITNNNGILYSEEEEARFLRSMGWEETGEEEEGLTEEEISAFVSKYLNLQAASKIFKGVQPKLLMTPMGKNGDISPNSRMES